MIKINSVSTNIKYHIFIVKFLPKINSLLHLIFRQKSEKTQLRDILLKKKKALFKNVSHKGKKKGFYSLMEKTIKTLQRARGRGLAAWHSGMA